MIVKVVGIVFRSEGNIETAGTVFSGGIPLVSYYKGINLLTAYNHTTLVILEFWLQERG